VNELYYAMLAIIAGSAIVAVAGGGILPMRAVWETAVDRVKRDTSRLGKFRLASLLIEYDSK
jgi:hypothetical protein